MPRVPSSLNNVDTAVNRNIDNSQYDNVKKVADNIDVVSTIGTDLNLAGWTSILDAGAITDAIEMEETGISLIKTVATNIDDVTIVANNIIDIQNAEENVIIAKEEAWRAEAERLTANSYATEPEDVYVKIYTSNNDGTFTITDTTDYSSYHWERKATTLIIEGIIDDDIISEEKVYSSSKVVELLEGKLNDNNGVIDLGSITDIIE